MSKNIFGRRILKPLRRDVLSSSQIMKISDVSHELRTPITIIRGYADILKNYGRDDLELFEEATTAIKNSAENMQKLVEGILFLARADQGLYRMNKNPVELNELLKRAVENFNNPRISLNPRPLPTVPYIGDGEFLKKMFSIFIDNALTYSEKKIIVTLTTAEDTAVVRITDRGVGISAENVDKIFDRFFRVDASRTQIGSEKNSTGLGLTIAKWIADQHDIKITVQSRLGNGSIFRLIFKLEE